MSKLKTICMCVMIMLAASAANGQTTWFVDDDSGCPGAGTEPDPFCTIQAGIDAAVSGDDVLVADGTYNELINFNAMAITVRSASGAGVTTIDGTGLNGYVVKCISGEGPYTVLDGFTITGGTLGGGMLNHNGSSPTVTNCTFNGNTSAVPPGGGGMLNLSESNPTVTNCTFSGNFGAVAGGGMHNSFSSPTVTNCTFSGNMAGASGGGGGMHNDGGSPVVTNCTFSGNNSNGEGGGMVNVGGSPTVVNCTFSGNMAVSNGGGMVNVGGSPTVTNCTFNGNSAGQGGGMYMVQSSATVTNCILWNDSPNEIFTPIPFTIFSTVSFSDVQGGLGGGTIDGGGNIDVNPLFVDADGNDNTVGTLDDDLRLAAGSPAIDAGDTPAYLGAAADIGGNPRAVDDPTTLDTGIVLQGITIPFLAVTIDMGAHESNRGGAGAVPTVSQWGLAVMTALLLTAATLVFARRRAAMVA